MNPLNPKGQRVFGVSCVMFLVLPRAKESKYNLKPIRVSSYMSLSFCFFS